MAETKYFDIVVSPEDHAEYRGFVLPNGLRVLLLSDKRVTQGAAAFDVGVGHFRDPHDIPGLAHFHEHMLFMGTKTYPEENEYDTFLKSNGGHSNAYTGEDHTQFFFEVNATHLEGALDRFSQFFICPLFSESATERELNAVESEHSKNLQSEMFRNYQLEKSTSDPSHPYSKFATGNKDTLSTKPKEKGINVREALLEFHDKYFGANVSTLAVCGNHDLDTLEKMVVSRFSSIRVTKEPRLAVEGNPFSTGLGILQKVIPIRDRHTVTLKFPLPPVIDLYKTKPCSYISHLVGHEGAGSILSLLKKRGWAQELVAGLFGNNLSFALFGCQIVLTDSGLEHWQEVVEVVFSYFRLIEKTGAQKTIWEECRDLGAIDFRYKSQPSPVDRVSHLASAVHDYEMQDTLVGPYLWSEFNADTINDYMRRMTPENCRIMLSSKTIQEEECTLSETWYGTKYSQEPFEEAMMKRWQTPSTFEDLRFPEPNTFIPSDFSLRCDDPDFKPSHEDWSKLIDTAKGESPEAKVFEEEASQFLTSVPKLIRRDDLATVWVQTDSYFRTPKAAYGFELVTPIANESPASAMSTELLVHILEDSLAEFSYDAELAQLNYKVNYTTRGLKVTVHGFSHKLPILLKAIFQRLADLQWTAEQFDRIYQVFAQQLKNITKNPPYLLSGLMSKFMVTTGTWEILERIAAGTGLTSESLGLFYHRLLRNTHIVCLATGNVNEKEALDVVETARAILSGGVTKSATLLRSAWPEERPVSLPHNMRLQWERPALNPEEPNGIVDLSFQIGPSTDLKLCALSSIFASILSPQAFSSLRSREQLGYIVHGGVSQHSDVVFIRLLVQSHTHIPDYCECRIYTMLSGLRKFIAEMDDEEFRSFKLSFIRNKLKRPDNYTSQFMAYNGEVTLFRGDFARPIKMAAEATNLTKKDVLDFMDRYMVIGAPQRRIVSCRILPGKEPKSEEIAEEAKEEDATKIVEAIAAVEPECKAFLQNIVRINAAEAVEIFNTMNCYDWSSKSAQLDPQELLYQAAKAAVRDEKKAEAIENARLKRCDFVVQVEHPQAMRASLPLLPDPRFMYGLELPAVETQQ